MPKHPDVLVVGGGVIGLTAAHFLAKAGARVVVCDRGQLGAEASWAGAGIIPPGNPARAVAPFDQLRARSSAMFPGLSDELREATGIDNGYRRCGRRVVGANTKTGLIAAGQTLISAGAWTGDLLRRYGVAVAVTPVRGQMLLLRTPAPILRRILERGKRYVVPRDDGRVLVGSTEE